MRRLPSPVQPGVDDCRDVGSTDRSDGYKNRAGRTATALAASASDDSRLPEAQRRQAVTPPALQRFSIYHPERVSRSPEAAEGEGSTRSDAALPMLL